MYKDTPRPRVQKGILRVDPSWWLPRTRNSKRRSGEPVTKQEERDWDGFAFMIASNAVVAQWPSLGVCYVPTFDVLCLYQRNRRAAHHPVHLEEFDQLCGYFARKGITVLARAMYPDDGRTKRTAFAIVIDASQDKMDWVAELMANVAACCRQKWKLILAK
jgi:hypothetical protein